MHLKIHTNKEIIEIITNATLGIKDIEEQLENGNLFLIETIYNTTFIINSLNINAIEILDNISYKNINTPQ